MKYLVVIFVLLLSFNSFTQTTSNGYSAFLPPQGYGIKLLNSSGTSSIFNDVSNLGFMNPAAISMFENYSFGISYQVSSSIDDAWVYDIGTSRVYNFFPQSFGGIGKWDNFTFGLGFGQKYNGTLNIGPILVTSFQNPSGTGELIDVIQETVVQSYSLAASYSFKELLQTLNDLSLGFRYSLNRFHRYEEIWNFTSHATDYFGNWAVGLNYQIMLDQKRELSLGLSYETEANFKAEIEIDADFFYLPPDIDSTSPPEYSLIESPVYTGETPSELRLDLEIDATQKLKFLTNLTAVFWESESNNLENQIEISASVLYKINGNLVSSLGFYYTDYNYAEDNFLRINGKLKAFFITAGLKLNYNMFYVDLALADSHLSSGDYRKQTIGKLAIGVHL